MKKMQLKFNNIEELIDLIYANIKNVTISKDEIIDIDQLSHWVYIDDAYANFMEWNYREHNLLNKTYGKKNVPTIKQNGSLFHNVMYCPNCKKMHTNIEYKGIVEFNSAVNYRGTINKIETFTCKECNTEYSFDEIKFINSTIEYIGGNIFVDDDKISIAYKYLYNSLNRYGNIYYEDGYVRLTLNTKTGYSFTTNKGHAYKELKRLWERYDMVPPVTFNSTYTMFDGTDSLFGMIVQCQNIERYKQMTKEELIKEFENIQKFGYYDIQREKEQELVKYVVEELYKKVQKHFHYELPKHILTAGNKQYHYVARMCKVFNRYVNFDCSHHNVHTLLDKDNMLKKNKINREEVNIINALFAAEGTKIGKKTRALVQQNLYHKDLFDLLPLFVCFKNPSNINVLVNAALDVQHNNLRHNFIADLALTVKLWLNYRDENYIVSQVLEAMKNNSPRMMKPEKSRLDIMRDTYFMLRRMTERLKNIEFDINEICIFRNEKQFHDDVTRFFNSDEYHELIENKETATVFDLEEEMLPLEDIDKNIFVAKNGGELRRIGRQMNICVGGYTDSVLRGQCRIVYIMDEKNETYKACLELKPNKSKKKTTYNLVQAKLKFNRRPCEDMEIYNKIKEWAELHDIAIVTYDMELPDIKQIFKQEVHAI